MSHIETSQRISRGIHKKKFFALWVAQGALDGRPARLDAGGAVSTAELYSQAFTTNSVDMAVLAITMEPFGQRIEINCDLPARPIKAVCCER